MAKGEGRRAKALPAERHPGQRAGAVGRRGSGAGGERTGGLPLGKEKGAGGGAGEATHCRVTAKVPEG